MKNLQCSIGLAACALAAFVAGSEDTVAAQKSSPGCALAPLPAPFRVVSQGGYLGGVNASGPLYRGGLGRQILVTTAVYADATTETIVAVSGAKNATETAGTVELFSFDATTGGLAHKLTLTAPGGGNPLAAGDINNDGVPDFALGSAENQKVYVFLSQAGTLSYAASITLTPSSATQDFGRWLATGNLDLSGGDELIVTAPGGGSGKSAVVGAAFVYRFNGTGFDAALPLDTTQLALKTDDRFAWRVSVGDVNNDGWPDILATAPRRDVNATDSGAVYVFFGPAFSSVSLLATSIKDDQLGNVMAADPNADLFGDVVTTTGQFGFNSTARRAVVFTGPVGASRFTPASSDYSVAAVNASLSDGWGTGIGSGDLNGDGISDILVGAPNAGSGACASIGAAHIYLSNASTPTLPSGYLLQPPALDGGWNAYGWSVAAVAQVAPGITTAGHPGYLLVGEPGRDISGVTDAGNLYVYRICSAAFACSP